MTRNCITIDAQGLDPERLAGMLNSTFQRPASSPSRLPELLREAARALEDAERQLQHAVTPEREAVQRELVQAATSIGRALHLIGAGP